MSRDVPAARNEQPQSAGMGARRCTISVARVAAERGLAETIMMDNLSCQLSSFPFRFRYLK
jgi:hypothetical protein